MNRESPGTTVGRAAGAALLCAVALGCEGGPQAVSDHRLVEVWISSPHQADQAILVTFQDPVEAFEVAPDFRHFQDPDRGAATALLVADWPLPAGETLVGRARLRTRSRTTLPTARVTEVARSDYQLRESLDGYRVRLVPVDR
jgi:hypothetical protein